MRCDVIRFNERQSLDRSPFSCNLTSLLNCKNAIYYYNFVYWTFTASFALRVSWTANYLGIITVLSVRESVHLIDVQSSTGEVCGRSLTAGKILYTGRQTCSLYSVLWLCDWVTSRCDVAHFCREELHHFLPVLLRGMLPLFSIMTLGFSIPCCERSMKW